MSHVHIPGCYKQTHAEDCYLWQIQELDKALFTLSTLLSRTQTDLRSMVSTAQRLDSTMEHNQQKIAEQLAVRRDQPEV